MRTSEIVRKLSSENNKSVTKVEEDLEFGNGSLTKDGYLRSDRLYALAQYFGVSMEYLMNGENPQPAAPSPFPLSDFERELVRAYRRADDIDQTSVRRTLGIDNAEPLKKGETA